jgi:glycosyltransferase involved in cell wall biosynthesis
VRLAVVNHFSSAGGGARFVRALVRALSDTVPGIEIGLFADAADMERDGLAALFADTPQVTLVALADRRIGEDAAETVRDRESAARRLLRPLRQAVKMIAPLADWYRTRRRRAERMETPAWAHFELDAAARERLAAYDVVYLAWPRFIEPVDLGTPVVCTMHDFNFRYPFGNFPDELQTIIDRQTPAWIRRSEVIVVSCAFMGEELERFYPGLARHTRVVRLTNFAISEFTEQTLAEALSRFDLPERFMVCASNTAVHKNLESLFRGMGEMRRRGALVPLVLTGHGTDEVGHVAGDGLPPAHPHYRSQLLSELLRDEGLEVGSDILALGYVSDVEMDALIRAAALVVSPSLYEAGSGPGVDAWASGTPVAFSDIPPFIEHLEYLGVEAWVFDPLDPHSIADVLTDALTSHESAAMAERSRRAIARRTWAMIAGEYAEAFQLAIDQRAH